MGSAASTSKKEGGTLTTTSTKGKKTTSPEGERKPSAACSHPSPSFVTSYFSFYAFLFHFLRFFSPTPTLHSVHILYTPPPPPTF
jgi:hypothetical protein